MEGLQACFSHSAAFFEGITRFFGFAVRNRDFHMPCAGQLLCWLVIIFIGWSYFTCACANFSVLCRFIGLSDFFSVVLALGR